MRDDAEGQPDIHLDWCEMRLDYRMPHATDVVEGSLRMFVLHCPTPSPVNLDAEIKKFLPPYTLP